MVGIISNSLQVLWKGCISVGFLAAAAALALFYYQDNILYIPDPDSRIPKITTKNPPRYRSPGEYDIHGTFITKDKKVIAKPIQYEEAFVTTSDGEKIHIWLMIHEDIGENIPTLIYFHGNAANMGYRLPNAVKMFGLIGINILMMDYRGYGCSTGTPNEKGINLDSEAVLNFAKTHPKLQNSPIILFGRSLGGAVALYLNQKRTEDISAFILENTFLSISAMVDALMPWAFYVKNFILRIGWNNESIIKNVKQPILFIAGALDEIVPPFHMKQLYDVAANAKLKLFYQILKGGHNDAWEVAGGEYYHRIRLFLEEAGVFLSKTGDSIQRNARLDENISSSASANDVCQDQDNKCTEPVEVEDKHDQENDNSEFSDDEYDKVTEEDFKEIEEAMAIPSVTTKYKMLHL